MYGLNVGDRYRFLYWHNESGDFRAYAVQWQVLCIMHNNRPTQPNILWLKIIDKHSNTRREWSIRLCAVVFLWFWATVSKTVRPVLSDRCLSCLSVCLSVTLVYCGQTVGWTRMPLGMEVGLAPGHIVLDGDTAAPKKGDTTTQFTAHVCCGQTAGRTKMPLGAEVGHRPGHIVLYVDAAPPRKGAQQPSTFGLTLLWHGRPSQQLLS